MNNGIKKSVSIFGTRGVPAAHGGFETFAHHLAPYLVTHGWNVTVYCQGHNANRPIYIDIWNNVTRVHITPLWRGRVVSGPLGTALFDLRAMWHACKAERGLWLTLGYNSGGLNILPRLLGRPQVINMDGVEWRRNKWSFAYKCIFYINYWLAGLAGNRLIADHPRIADMLMNHFYADKITMIPYGADRIGTAPTELLEPYGVAPGMYAVVIARAEPENSLLQIVRAWSRKPRAMKLLVLGHYNADNAYQAAVRAAASNDVVFPGAIFDQNIVQALRYHARVYIHGHTVGGTNPSLVESLGAGNAVIAHDNHFNRWVAGDAGRYFTNEVTLAVLFDGLLSDEDVLGRMRVAARDRFDAAFQWDDILAQYEYVLDRTLSGGVV
jgi:glycosyltransferase involved in cell wall biosynthesis